MEKDLVESYTTKFAVLAAAAAPHQREPIALADVFRRTELLRDELAALRPDPRLRNTEVVFNGKRESLADVIQTLDVHRLEMAFFLTLKAYPAFLERVSSALFILAKGVIENRPFLRNPEVDAALYAAMARLYAAIGHGCGVVGTLPLEKRAFLREADRLAEAARKIEHACARTDDAPRLEVCPV